MDSLGKMREIVVKNVREGKSLDETFEEINEYFGNMFNKSEVEEEYRKSKNIIKVLSQLFSVIDNHTSEKEVEKSNGKMDF
jgi:hypothetical protein